MLIEAELVQRCNLEMKIKNARLFNTTAIVSSYVDPDPQGGIVIEAFSEFFLSY